MDVFSFRPDDKRYRRLVQQFGFDEDAEMNTILRASQSKERFEANIAPEDADEFFTAEAGSKSPAKLFAKRRSMTKQGSSVGRGITVLPDDEFEAVLDVGLSEDDLDPVEQEQLAFYSKQLQYATRNERELRSIFPTYARAGRVTKAPHLMDESDDFYFYVIKAVCMFGWIDGEDLGDLQEVAARASDAFFADQAQFAAAIEQYRLSDDIAQEFLIELNVQLEMREQNPAYPPDAFDSEEEYRAFLRAEREDLEELIARVREPRPLRIPTEASSRKQSRSKKAHDTKQKKKKKKKKTSGLAGCFGLCCGSSAAEVDEPVPISNAEVQMAAAVDERSLQMAITDEVERRRNNKNAVNFASHFRLLVWILYHYESLPPMQRDEFQDANHVGLTVPCTIVTSEPKSIPVHPLKRLSKEGVAVLDRFARLYRIGRVQSLLERLNLHCLNLADNEDYFREVADLAADLLDAFVARSQPPLSSYGPEGQWKNVPWTASDLSELPRLLSDAFDWCRRCVTHYQVCFHQNSDALFECVDAMITLYEALEQCSRDPNLKCDMPELALPRLLHGGTPSRAAMANNGDFVFDADDDEEEPQGAPTLAEILAHDVRAAIGLQYARLVRHSLGKSTQKTVEQEELATEHRESAASVRHRECMHELGLDAAMHTASQITDTQQLAQLFEAVKDELRADRDVFNSAFAEVPEFSLLRSTANKYLGLIWSDASLFLRIRGLPEMLEEHFDTRVLALYDDMREFYAFCGRFVQLDKYELQSWFKPFVQYWLDQRKSKFTGDYIDNLLLREKWDVVAADKHFAHSVLDLFRLLYPVARAFQRMPYSPEQITAFATFICDVVKTYVDRVLDSVERDFEKVDQDDIIWGFKYFKSESQFKLVVGDDLVVRMNSIRVCKMQLFRLLETIDLERAYDHPPVFTGDDELSVSGNGPAGSLAVPPVTHKRSVSTSVSDVNEMDPALQDLLGCDDSFKHIKSVLDRICDHIARGIVQFPAITICSAVTREPADREFPEEAMEALLSPMWRFLMTHMDNFTDIAEDDPCDADLFDDVFYNLAACTLGYLIEACEWVLVYPRKGSWKNTLTRAQIKRLNHVLALIMLFFDQDYKPPAAYLTDVYGTTLARLRVAMATLSQDTDDLVELWEGLGEEREEQEEAVLEEGGKEALERFRRQNEPYVSRALIFQTLRYRKEREDDPAAAKFIREHTSFLKRLSIF